MSDAAPALSVVIPMLDEAGNVLPLIEEITAALKAYAEWVGISESLAKEIRDQFYPRENLRLDRLSGLNEAMADEVSLKFLPAPLTKPQIDELFKYYARGAK